jgi:hypothetical protein
MSHFHLFFQGPNTGGRNAEVYGECSLCDPTNEEGNAILFPPRQTANEIDAEIDRLITQLNAARHKAKEKIADRLRE